MSSWDDDEYYARDAAMADLAQQTLKDRSIEGSRFYLGTFGDAVDERISSAMANARALQTTGNSEAALVFASTAIELSVRYLLVRPLVQGAFLSDEWAEILASRIGTGRTDEDRKILPSLLRQWSVDIDSVRISNGEKLWDVVTKRLLPKRNRVVHAGESASPAEALLSIECVELLQHKIVHVIARNLGFTLERTGKWCRIHGKSDGNNHHQWWSSFQPKSPFDENHV